VQIGVGSDPKSAINGTDELALPVYRREVGERNSCRRWASDPGFATMRSPDLEEARTSTIEERRSRTDFKAPE